MRESVRALLSSIVDYAGLFPPAKLDMTEAVETYASYRGGEHAWMLGRFVVPEFRLDEFTAAAKTHFQNEPWRLSAIVGESLADASAARLAGSHSSGAPDSDSRATASLSHSATSANWSRSDENQKLKRKERKYYYGIRL